MTGPSAGFCPSLPIHERLLGFFHLVSLQLSDTCPPATLTRLLIWPSRARRTETMPLPRRLDTSEGLFERWWSRHRLWPKLPACGILGFVVLFGLWEHAHVVRYSAARPSQAVPSMNLGWQSGFAAYSARPETALPASTAAANATANNTDADSSAASGTEQSNGGWLGNAIAEEWDPFVPNMAPLVEVTAKSCMWPPSVYDACVPDSSLREDAERGKWVRVEKDLNLRAGICECLRPVSFAHARDADVRIFDKTTRTSCE